MVTSTTRLLSDYIEINENEEYYCSVENTSYQIHNIVLFDKNKNHVGELYTSVTGENEYEFIAGNTYKYVRVIIRNANSSAEITLNEVETAQPQLEQGSTKTDYIPHEEQSVTFPLEEGQYMAEGDYLADNGIHHKWGQKIFTGTENTFGKNRDNYWGFYFTGYFNTAGADLTRNNKIISTHHKVKSTAQEAMSDYGCFLNSSNGNFYFSAEGLIETNTVEALKTKLAQLYTNGNPMIVEYPLATETIEPYTQAQQEAYDKIQKLMSYKGVTHISQENDNLPFNLKVVYRKDLEMILDTVNSRLEALEQAE